MIVVTREEGELLAAAIRVLEHREDTPPDAEQVAGLLDLPPESIRLKIASLVEAGILMRIESAWKTHLQLGDTSLLAQLKPEDEQTGMEQDLKDFDRRRREEADRMDQLFSDGTLAKQRQKKLDEMEKGLFDGKPEKPANPFDD